MRVVVKLWVAHIGKDGYVAQIPTSDNDAGKHNSEFFVSKSIEDLPGGSLLHGYAHRPYWTAVSVPQTSTRCGFMGVLMTSAEVQSFTLGRARGCQVEERRCCADEDHGLVRG